MRENASQVKMPDWVQMNSYSNWLTVLNVYLPDKLHFDYERFGEMDYSNNLSKD